MSDERKLQKAIEELEFLFVKAKTLQYVENPLAWALYHTWRWAEKNVK